jgi:carbon storage regulator
MLVLSRKKNESITIDDTIIVTIVDIRADKVRLGVQFPQKMSVHRSELARPPTPTKEPADRDRPGRVEGGNWKEAFHELLDRLIDVEREKRKLEDALAGKADAAPLLVAEFEGIVRESDKDSIVIACETNGVALEQTYRPSQFIDGRVPLVGDRVSVSMRVMADKK